MKSVSAWVATHAPTGTRWGRRTLALLLSLVLCLTLLPGAAFAAGDTSGHWAEKTITDWQQKGYISGYSDGSFRPDSSITRAEFIKILNRVLGLTAEGSISFSDVRESDWFYAEVAKAVAAGYAQGSADGTFRPNAPITRAEAAAMLARAFKLTENEARAAQFTDADAIPAWARGSVGAVAEAGYMTGYPDGSFGASGSITRAEAVVTADRAERAAAEDTKKPITPGTTPGGTVTPPAQKTSVTGVQPVSAVTVDYGTSANAAIAKLPQKVTLTCKDGTTVEADVTWTLERAFTPTPTDTTTYTATGTVTIPSGYTYNGTLTVTAKITVRGGDKTIQSVVAPDGIQVNYGTSETDAMKRLSTEATLKLLGGGVTFGAVTWTRKSGETYNATPTGTAAVMTYTGTVTLPAGYSYQGKQGTTSIETTITVLPSGQTAKPKYVVKDPPSIVVYVEKYIDPQENGAALSQYLPEEIRLYCEGGSPVTAQATAAWDYLSSTFGQDGYQIHSFTYPFSNMQLPTGYQFKEGLDTASAVAIADVYLPHRDEAKLKEAMEAADTQLDRIVTTEEDALADPEKIWKASDETTADQVATGAKFIEAGKVAQQKSQLEALCTEANGYLNNPTISQEAVDQKTAEINAAVEYLQEILDSAQTGTGFTRSNILANIREWLEKQSNCAYQPDNQPLTPKNDETATYLPYTATSVKINAAGDLGNVYLQWSMAQTDYAELYGEQSDNWHIRVKEDAIAQAGEPQKISLTVTATYYYDPVTKQTVTLNKEVATYDCIIGAPLRRNEAAANILEKPKLTAGETNSVRVLVPFLYNAVKIKAINVAPNEITVEDISNYTGEGTTLLSNLQVTEVKSEQTISGYDNQLQNHTAMTITITATAAQLSAVVDPTAETDHVAGKVRITIPKAAVTLTDWAIQQGYYIPDDGLVLEADVWVCKPAIKNTEAKLDDSKNNVTVTFDAEHWKENYSQTVWMALVPSSKDTFPSDKAEYFKSTFGKGVFGTGTNYSVDISVSKLTPNTEYAVWVGIEDSNDNITWTKSSTTYTHSTT